MSHLQDFFLNKACLLWPVLPGLALAYLWSGMAHYQNPPEINTITQSSYLSQVQQDPHWEGLILEKNILNLEIPRHEPQPQDSGPDPQEWTLLGTFTGENPLALISIDGQTYILSTGDSQKGWELADISPRATTWTASGHESHLLMGSSDKGHDRQASLTEQQVNERASSQKITLARSEIKNVLQDPNALLDMARFNPYQREGQTSGFEITNIRQNSLLSELGIENGDVLARIDGRPIRNPADLLQAYSSLEQSSLVSINIIRDGANMDFVVEID